MHKHITLITWLAVIAMVAPVLAVPRDMPHDHHDGDGHDHGPAATETDEQLEALTREQVIQPAIDARQTRDQAWIDSTTTFRDQVRDAKANLDEQQHQRMDELIAALGEQLDAIEQDRYISKLVGEDEPLADEALAEAQRVYLDTAIGADEAYVEALRAALARDRHGYIGDMIFDELATSTDTNLMWLLMDWYWHHQMLDTPPRSFERIIQLGYRYLELEPQSPTVYCDTAWLLWSRWVSWQRDPERMPVGEGDDAAAHRLLLAGRAANLDDATYHINAGMTLWGLATYHDAKYYDFIITSFKLAEEHAPDQDAQIKAIMLLGHTYRKMDRPADALVEYRRVLEIDPDHEIATRLIDELEHPPAED